MKVTVLLGGGPRWFDFLEKGKVLSKRPVTRVVLREVYSIIVIEKSAKQTKQFGVFIGFLIYIWFLLAEKKQKIIYPSDQYGLYMKVSHNDLHDKVNLHEQNSSVL